MSKNPQNQSPAPQAEIANIRTAAAVLPGVTYAGIKYVNLTDHPIHIRIGNEQMVKFPPSGTVARVQYNKSQREAQGLQIYKLRKPVIVGLPEPADDVVLLVSAQVRAQLTADDMVREDVLSPYMITPIVGADGREVRCATALAC